MRSIRVLMVTGYTNPWGSPISHHADRLGEALAGLDAGVEVERFARPTWGVSTLRDVLRAANLHPGTIVHLHYPMSAMGRSPVPALLAARTRAVLTIHEATSIGRWLGRAKIAPAVALASAAVFTDEFERKFVAGAVPWVRRRSHVIPLASNIPGATGGAPEQGRVVGFGTIRPSSGWEQFADLARLAKDSHPDWTFAAIGHISPDMGWYREELLRRAGDAILEFTGELPPEDVARELGRGMVAYLPYHDGASGRRSSLLAAMANGLPVVSRAGAHTTAELRGAIALAQTPESAMKMIEQLMADAGERARLITAANVYTEARSWPAVARRYLQVYRSLRP